MIHDLVKILNKANKTKEFNAIINKLDKPLSKADVMSALFNVGLIDKFEAKDYVDSVDLLFEHGILDTHTCEIDAGKLMLDPTSDEIPIIEEEIIDDEPTIALDADLFIKKYRPLLDDRTYEQTFYGSSGSGKSYFIAQRNLYWMMQNTDEMPICNILVLRNDEVTNYKSTFPLYKQIIQEWGLEDLFRTNERPALIEYIPNGNQIIFSGFNNPENLKSITFKNGILTTVHVEEATEIKLSSAINILKTRLRGLYKGKKISKCIIYSYNPISDLNWVKNRLDDPCVMPHPSLILNPEQSDDMYHVRCDNVDNIRKLIIHSTHNDNNFLTDEDHETLEAFKLTDPYYYQVYCLGNYGSASADYFNKNNLYNRQLHIKAMHSVNKICEFNFDYDGLRITNVTASDITNIYKANHNINPNVNVFLQYKDDNYAKYINVFEEPKKGHVYCIGADTSGASGSGTSKYSDFNTCVVVDVTDSMSKPKQVAAFRSKCREEELAQTLYCLGMYYNRALISVETNFSTYPVKELERLRYPYLFVRKQEDSYMQDTQKKFGFQTNRLTRPLLLAGLRQYIQESADSIFDVNMIIEALTFGRNDKGRLEALDGAHDDMVMAYGITLYSVEQTPRAIFDTLKQKLRADNNLWTHDLLMDYQKADLDTKHAMIDEYGEINYSAI